MTSKRPPFWVHVDFGSDCEIVRQEDRPGSEWQGPFRTFGDAKRCIVVQARDEISELRWFIEVWGHKRLSEIEDET